MRGFGFNIVLAFSAGLLLVIQGVMNAYIGKTQDQFAMIIGVSAAQIAAASFLMWRLKPVPLQFSYVPWMLMAGILGVGIMFCVSYATGSIGALPVFVTVIAGQIVASAVMDHFGFMGLPRAPFTLQKSGSILVILLGVLWLIKSSK